MCRSKGALHTKRLTSTGDSDTYLCRWKLYVPEDCLIEKEFISMNIQEYLKQCSVKSVDELTDEQVVDYYTKENAGIAQNVR